MSIVVILLLCIAVILPIIKRKNKYMFLFSIGFMSIDIIILCSIFYISMIDIHTSQLDYMLVKWARPFRVSFFTLKTVVAAMIGVFLATMYHIYSDRRCRSRYSMWMKTAAFYILDIAFVIINSSWFAEYVYLWSYEGAHTHEFYDNMKRVMSFGSNLFILGMCILPYFKLVTNYRYTRLIFKKKNISRMFVMLVFIQAIFLFVIYMPSMHSAWETFEIYRFDFSRSFFESYAYKYILLVILFIAVLGIFISKDNVLDGVRFDRYSWRRKSKFDMTEIRHILHTQKNVMMIILALDESAISNYGTDEGLGALHNIKGQVLNFSSQMNKLLDFYNTMRIDFKSIQIVDCVRNAIANLKFVSDTEICLDLEAENYSVYGDSFKLSEMFYNLISNANDAVAEKGSGKITVRIWNEDKWVCVSVFDNGIGMSQKTILNLSRPFYTTKKTYKNMGLGLPYCKKVVKIHDGCLDFRSRYGSFSEFQVILPLDDSQ